MATAYDTHFYDDQADGSFASSAQYVPYILELTQAKSVVDVGCGVGAWLQTYADAGVKDLLGIDGAWVDPTKLYIPRDKFTAVDLLDLPSLARRFDLAQSLEVAEHLLRLANQSRPSASHAADSRPRWPEASWSGR